MSTNTTEQPSRLSHDIDVPLLLEVVDEARFARSTRLQTVTWRSIADQVGISSNYMDALKQGRKDRPSAATVVSLLMWLDLPDDELGRLVRRITVSAKDE
jgi:transcriptional regulator with XRE-family HTH domain